MLVKRSLEKEILDGGPGSYNIEDYKLCMKKLFIVNKLFGYFRASKRALKQFSSVSSVLDVGCGGGLFLLNLHKVFPKMSMLGIDISTDAINLAQEELQQWKRKFPNSQVTFQLQTEKSLQISTQPFDVVFATLVCHHLTDDELIIFLQESNSIARQAVVINDLHRHYLAYYLYKFLSPILFRNKLITHDGLISIRRGFTRNEWIGLLQKANIQRYQIKWGFPFRWQIIIQK